MTSEQYRVSRRRFLQASALATALPAWYREECLAEAPTESARKTNSASDSLRFGLIGCGGRGSADAGDASRFGKVVAVCDVDADHVAQAKHAFAGAEGYKDFRKLLERKDIDAVICGTVDHWHALVSIAAMKAGKDVYCEKPLTLCIGEGRRIADVQKETGRILQTGTQQRSDVYFRMACDLIRNGRIGKVQSVEVWLPAGLRQGPFKTTAVPQAFNYDFWLGQTPSVPYVRERTHFSFRYWWEYSGGTMTDWGAHHNDIVLWVLDPKEQAPVSVEGKQTIAMIPGGFTAASEYEVTYTYANGIVHHCRSTTGSEWNGGVKDAGKQQHGIKFIGSQGWIWVTRGAINASDRHLLSEPLPAGAKRAYSVSDHMRNFVEGVKTRKPTICPAEVGHRSATLCHLGTTAIRLGRKLNWDPVHEQYIDDDEANRFVSREMRKPYDWAMIS